MITKKKRYTTFINRFSNPLLLYTKRTTNTQTHTQQLRFNNIDIIPRQMDLRSLLPDGLIPGNIVKH